MVWQSAPTRFPAAFRIGSTMCYDPQMAARNTQHRLYRIGLITLIAGIVQMVIRVVLVLDHRSVNAGDIFLIAIAAIVIIAGAQTTDNVEHLFAQGGKLAYPISPGGICYAAVSTAVPDYSVHSFRFRRHDLGRRVRQSLHQRHSWT